VVVVVVRITNEKEGSGVAAQTLACTKLEAVEAEAGLNKK
jgi:hypothetical protein